MNPFIKKDSAIDMVIEDLEKEQVEEPSLTSTSDKSTSQTELSSATLEELMGKFVYSHFYFTIPMLYLIDSLIDRYGL